MEWQKHLYVLYTLTVVIALVCLLTSETSGSGLADDYVSPGVEVDMPLPHQQGISAPGLDGVCCSVAALVGIPCCLFSPFASTFIYQQASISFLNFHDQNTG